jgi:hypothetical protein
MQLGHAGPEPGVYWHKSWDARPDDGPLALEIARNRLAEVPVMVPIYGHRYLPAGQGTYGHPVLSMWQTDIICYGRDLADYIDREFAERSDGSEDDDVAAVDPAASLGSPVLVEFWRDYLRL